MYGAIARLRIRSGTEQQVIEWAENAAAAARAIPGYVKSILYRMDADASVLMLAVIFDSRDTYRACLPSFEQQVKDAGMTAFLTAEPEWRYGEGILYLTGGERADDEP